MIHVFFDPASGDVQHTARLALDIDPSRLGAWVVSDLDIDNPHRWQVVGGELVRRVVVTDVIRSEAIEGVNRWRGMTRRPWITVLPGQDMVYLDKERQALALLADADPDPADYPGLAAEVGITAPTLYEVAQVVANLAQLWREVSAQIESAAMGAIAQIEAAVTVAEIDIALDGLPEILPPAQ